MSRTVPMVILLMLPLVLFAQTRDVPGYYLTHEGDTINGLLTIPTRYSASEPAEELLHWRIYHRSTASKKGTILTPPEIAGFGFDLRGQDFAFMSVPNVNYLENPFKEPAERIFLKTVVKGEVVLLTRPISRYYGGGLGTKNQSGDVFQCIP